MEGSQKGEASETDPSVRTHLLARLALAFVAAWLAAMTGGDEAMAARQPTFREREALALALPASLRRYPVGCVWLKIAVSNDGRFARIAPGFLNATRPPCLQYASNGYWLLKKTTRWKIIFNGSDKPPCTLHVPHDLTTCAR